MTLAYGAMAKEELMKSPGHSRGFLFAADPHLGCWHVGFCHQWWRALSAMVAGIIANPGNLTTAAPGATGQPCCRLAGDMPTGVAVAATPLLHHFGLSSATSRPTSSVPCSILWAQHGADDHAVPGPVPSPLAGPCCPSTAFPCRRREGTSSRAPPHGVGLCTVPTFQFWSSLS